MRIIGQLIDAISGAHIWADRFEGGLEDIFDLQDQVARSVIGAIVPQLDQAEMDRARRKPPGNLDAYDCLLRGMAISYPQTREAADEAQRLFYSTIQGTPPYALAAWCHSRRAAQGWTTDRARETAETARLARRAITLGKDDAFVLTFAGYALGFVVGEVEDARAFVDRALVLNANLASAWIINGWVRLWFGEPEIAMQHLAQATRLSPFDQRMPGLQVATASVHLFGGRYDEAYLWAAKAQRDFPDAAMPLRVAAASNALAGRLEHAQRLMDRLFRIDATRRISNMRDTTGPLRPEDFEKLVEGLRMAGMPE